MIDAKALGLELAGMVKAEIAPLIARIDLVESRLAEIPAPVDLTAELAELKAAVESVDIPTVPELPELPDFASMVAAAVTEAVAAFPTPRDGKSVTIDDVAPLIASEVEKRVSQLPLPKDGKDGDPGRDGLDVKEMFRAEGGRLIAVMSDGTVRDLGAFVGKDGEPGKGGRDGFSLKDFDATLLDDGRTLLLSFDSGDQSFKVELGIPAMIYRGVYQDGGTYQKGDTVTWGGSLWHCDAGETAEKPDSAEKHWTLAAKKGRDGKDGLMKEAKAQAPLRIGGDVRNG